MVRRSALASKHDAHPPARTGCRSGRHRQPVEVGDADRPAAPPSGECGRLPARLRGAANARQLRAAGVDPQTVVDLRLPRLVDTLVTARPEVLVLAAGGGGGVLAAISALAARLAGRDPAARPGQRVLRGGLRSRRRAAGTRRVGHRAGQQPARRRTVRGGVRRAGARSRRRRRDRPAFLRPLRRPRAAAVHRHLRLPARGAARRPRTRVWCAG